MATQQYCLVSGIFFSLVSIAHLLRILYGLPITVDDYVVPMLFSWIGFIVPAALALWAFRLSRGTGADGH